MKKILNILVRLPMKAFFFLPFFRSMLDTVEKTEQAPPIPRPLKAIISVVEAIEKNFDRWLTLGLFLATAFVVWGCIFGLAFPGL